MNLSRWATFVLTALITFTSSAAEIRELDRECEKALALSAAPKHLRSNAGVYVLASDGYELITPASNGFACIVERNHKDSVVPQCFDQASFEANLAVVLDEGKLLRQGKSFLELREHRKQALAAGRYPSASPGLVYMISAYNYIYSYPRNVMLNVAPHLMFHAPGVTNEDVGADFRAALSNRGLPTVNATGPHGFMISFVQRASDSSAVRAHCEGQLIAEQSLLAFPDFATE